MKSRWIGQGRYRRAIGFSRQRGFSLERARAAVAVRHIWRRDLSMSPVLEPCLRLLQCNNGSDHGLFDAASPSGRGNGQRRRSFSFRDVSLALGPRLDRRRLRRHRNEPDLRLPRSRPRGRRPRRPPSEAAVFGVLSLIVWSLILVVTVKYVLILIRADNNGEGGTLALMALAQRSFKGMNSAILILGVIAAALFYGDAVITPALSVLSAVEGLEVAAPSLTEFVLPLTFAILAGALPGSVARYRPGGGLFRPDHRGLVRRDRLSWRRPCRAQSAGAGGGRSYLRDRLSRRSRNDRALDPRRGLSVRDRGGGALRRSGSFRPPANSNRVARPGPAVPLAQLLRPGRAGSAVPGRGRESVLSHGAGLAADPLRRPGNGGHGHCQPGGHHRHVFDDPAGHPAGPAAAARDPPHLRRARRPDLSCRASTSCFCSPCSSWWPCSARRARSPVPTALRLPERWW